MNTTFSYKSLFLVYLLIIEGCVKVLEKKHHSNDVSNIKSYQVIILKRIFKSLSTIEFVISKEYDPISAYGMLRMIIDSICAYCFIYEQKDREEVVFRHYLYLLDGCSQYNNMISTLVHREERERTEKEELQYNSCNLKTFQHGIEKALGIHSYSKMCGQEVEKIIKSANWKYKYFGGEGENKYNWEELYVKIGCDCVLAKFISNYLSQYVHGLFLSNTLNPQAASHYQLIYNTLAHFCRRLIRSLNKTFAEENLFENFEVDSQKLLNSGINFQDVGECMKELCES